MSEPLDLLQLRPRALPGFAATPYGAAEGGRQRYLVRDASQMHYMMTSQAGVRILELLDGERSTIDVQQHLAERWSIRYSVEKLGQFIDACARNHMVDIESWPHMAANTREAPQRYMGIEGLLAFMDRWRVVWRSPVAALLVLGLLGLGLWHLLHMPQQGGMLATIKQLTYTPMDVLFAAVPLLFFIEVFLHEAAHALACHAMGARTRGFAFVRLYGVLPAVVTDTAQANFLPSKYQRMWVSFAGPLVNIISFGLMMGWYQMLDPGSFLARLVIAYSGFSLLSIFINLNPFLLRTDGYWLVADFVEQPNLRKLALRHLKLAFFSLLGRKLPASDLDSLLSRSPRVRLQYALYAVLAFGWTAAFLTVIGLELVQVVHIMAAMMSAKGGV